MKSFTQVSDTQCELVVDNSIFNEQIILKMTYWFTEKYCFYWKSKSDNEQTILFEKKQGNICPQEYKLLKEKVNQLLIDYRNREIINQETKNIRDILYIKAFANNDDYEDFSLNAE